jgi:hypothetical protein
MKQYARMLGLSRWYPYILYLSKNKGKAKGLHLFFHRRFHKILRAGSMIAGFFGHAEPGEEVGATQPCQANQIQGRDCVRSGRASSRMNA